MPTGQQWLGEGGQGGRRTHPCVHGGACDSRQAGFKLRSAEYAATGYFFFTVSRDGS